MKFFCLFVLFCFYCECFIRLHDLLGCYTHRYAFTSPGKLNVSWLWSLVPVRHDNRNDNEHTFIGKTVQRKLVNHKSTHYKWHYTRRRLTRSTVRSQLQKQMQKHTVSIRSIILEVISIRWLNPKYCPLVLNRHHLTCLSCFDLNLDSILKKHLLIRLAMQQMSMVEAK